MATRRRGAGSPAAICGRAPSSRRRASASRAAAAPRPPGSARARASWARASPRGLPSSCQIATACSSAAWRARSVAAARPSSSSASAIRARSRRPRAAAPAWAAARAAPARSDGGQRDVADGEQGGGLAHAGPEPRRALGEGARLLGVIAGEDARQARERGDERLQVAHGVAAARRLLIGSAGERRVTALAVDVAQDAQRVGDVVGAQALVDQARGVEVGDRLLQVAEAQPRLAAVGQRQGAEGPEARPGRRGGWRDRARRWRPRRRPPPGCASRG